MKLIAVSLKREKKIDKHFARFIRKKERQPKINKIKNKRKVKLTPQQFKGP